MIIRKRPVPFAGLLVLSVLVLAVASMAVPADGKTGRQWEPVEWSFENPSYSGNPYDLVAKASLKHQPSGEVIATELFYDGGKTWKLRFTGTKPGKWKFVTKSKDPDLHHLGGEVSIEPNPGVAGFMTAYGNRWGRLGLDEAFVPQFVGYPAPKYYYRKPGRIDADIETWFGEHGFNGLQTFCACSFFDMDKFRYSEILSSDPNPDPRTFEALELLITKVHAAGGVVHIWAWGDEQRKMTPVKWGINGPVDRRLQRYICARLGPLPGWSMCYGWDLQEWARAKHLAPWHKYMHDHLGWFHFLGGRSPEMTQIYDGLDYSSYQKHRPTYDTYVEAIEQRHPGKPSFLEDRFRVRVNVYPKKDYDLDMTRRGLWASTLAGGAANIWAYLIDPPEDGRSRVYPNKDQLLTYARFWRDRFTKEMVRRNSLTNGVCLTVPGKLYVFYKEDCDAIRMDLVGMVGPLPAVAVDAKAGYEEIPLGLLKPDHACVFQAPRRSDWAVAVGGPKPAAPPQIDLGLLDAEAGVLRVQMANGDTIAVDKGGKKCRRNEDSADDTYVYFNVLGSFAYQGSRPELYILIEYYDEGTGKLRLQYDAAGDAKYEDGGSIELANTRVWKQYQFHIKDAYFGNRQNGGADFRIAAGGHHAFWLNTIKVADFDLLTAGK